MEQLVNNEIKIIKLPIGQWQEYKELRLRALKTEPQAFSSSHAKETTYPDEKWQERLKSANEGITSWMYFARKGNGLVGMIGGYRDENNLRNHTAQIWGVYVDPEYRGKGIAKSLKSILIDSMAQNIDINTIKLEVNTDQGSAKKLYEHFGFKSLDTVTLLLGDGVEHQVTNMEKFLVKE